MRVLVALVMATSSRVQSHQRQAKVLVTINKSAQRLTVSVDGKSRYDLGGFHRQGGSRHTKRNVPRVPHGERPLLKGMG